MSGLLILLLYLLLGTGLQHWLALPIPASILGMLCLLLTLIIRGHTPSSLSRISQTLAPLLPLFLIPVSAGIVTQKPLLQEHGVMLIVILAVSLIPGILVCGWVMHWGHHKERRNKG